MRNQTQNTSTPTRQKMPIDVFSKLWKGEMKVVGTKWEKHVSFKWNSANEATHINLVGLTLEGHIFFEKNIQNIVLANCSIGGLIFAECKINSIFIEENSTIKSIVLYKNSTANEIIIQNSEITTALNLDENTSVQNIFVKQNAYVGVIFIKEKSNISLFSVEGNSTCNTFKCGVDSTIRSFLIGSMSKINRISIWGDSKIIEMLIQESRVEELSTSFSSLRFLNVEKQAHLGKASFKHTTFGKIDIKNSHVRQLECEFNLLESVQILLDQNEIGIVQFNNVVFPQLSTLHFTNCKINCLVFNNFCNYGTVFFSNLVPIESRQDFAKNELGAPNIINGFPQLETIAYQPTLRITDSDLGKMQFMNCNLRLFQRFEFLNSKLLDVFTAGTQMPHQRAFSLPNNIRVVVV